MKTTSMNTRHLTEKTSAFLWSRAENTIAARLFYFSTVRVEGECRPALP